MFNILTVLTGIRFRNIRLARDPTAEEHHDVSYMNEKGFMMFISGIMAFPVLFTCMSFVSSEDIKASGKP